MKKLQNSFQKLSLPRWGRVLSVVAAVGIGVADLAVAEPQTVYKETYSFCTGTLIGADAAAQAGWYGLVSGQRQGKIGNLKVFEYGNAELG